MVPTCVPRLAVRRSRSLRKGRARRQPGRPSRSNALALQAALVFLLMTVLDASPFRAPRAAASQRGPSAAQPATEGRAGELVIFAAASLKDVLVRLNTSFEQSHPGAHVTTSIAGSQELRVQIEHGATVDLFVSADEKNMAALVEERLADPPSLFACNDLAVAVRRDLPTAVLTMADLPNVDRLVMGSPESPIGRYTSEVLRRASVDLGPDFTPRVLSKVVSRELNVKQVVAKVVLGEADGGFVYRTDVLAAGDKVRLVGVPPAWNVTATYPAAVLTAAPHAALARAWLAAAAAAPAKVLLEAAGFSRCPPP